MRFLHVVLAFVGSLVFASSAAWAQFATVLNLPPDTLPYPIASNTQVNVFDGGLIGSSHQSGSADGTSSNIEINVFGGLVDERVRLYAGTTLNASGGMVGRELEAFSGSVVNLTGGRILQGLLARSGSTINISNGIVDPGFRALGGSSVFINGGSVGPEFRMENGSQVSLSNGLAESAVVQPGGSMTMSGGDARLVVEGNLNLSGGTVRRNFDTYAGGQVRILGGEYRLNGEPIAELQNTGDTFAPNIPAGAVLSGTLTDGTPFAFSSWADDEIAAGTLTLETVALPSIGPAVIVASTDPVPRGIRTGQQLIIDNGATTPTFFNAGWGTTVKIQAGGVLEGGFEGVNTHIDIEGGTTKGTMIAYAQSTINIAAGSNVTAILADGGSIVDMNGGNAGFIDITSGSVLNLHAGTLASGLSVHSGATANIFAGTVGPFLRPLAGSTLNVHGGTLGSGIHPRGQVSITGGAIGDLFEPSAGSTVEISGGSFGDAFRAQSGSVVTLSGGDFRLNGNPIPGLDPNGANMPINVPVGAVLSGVLSDGTPFAFASTDDDILTDGTLTLATTSLTAITVTALVVPGDDVGSGIRGQQLDVLSGGTIGDNFNVGPGSTVTLIAGGAIGRNLEAVGAVLNIRGGTVGQSLDAFAGTTVNITGGTIGESLGAHPGSIVNISGGSVGFALQAFDESMVNIRGTEFLLDGLPITGLTPGLPFELLARTGNLTGRLGDGSAFSIFLRGGGRLPAQLIAPGATLNLIVVPEPVSGALVVSCIIGLARQRLRRR